MSILGEVSEHKTFIGVDGFRGGWVAVWIDESGRQGFDYSPTIDRLLSYPHSKAMIDIPIGLPERDLSSL